LNEGLQPVSADSAGVSELPVELDTEDALEDVLENLDIPDIPVCRQEAKGNDQGLSGLKVEVTDRSADWHPSRLVVRPFASDYFAEEVIVTLPPPLKADGSSISKYFTASNCQESLQSVREASDWPSIKDDPVFQRIADDGPSILIDYLRAHRTWSGHDEPRNDSEAEEDGSSRELDAASSQGERKDGHGWSVMDNLEQALNSRDVFTTPKQRPLTTVDSNNLASVESWRQVDDGAGIVSPYPRPIPKSTFHAHNGSLDQTASSRSGSPESLDGRNQ